MTEEEEARRLAELFADNPAGLLKLLSDQLAVLKGQAQSFMGLATLTITVTGFSGHNMVRGGPVPTLAMIGGVAAVLAGILLTLRTLGRLRWVSQDLGDDLAATARRVIRRRDAEQRAIGLAGRFIVAGLAAYLVSVVMAALSAGERFGPP